MDPPPSLDLVCCRPILYYQLEMMRGSYHALIFCHHFLFVVPSLGYYHPPLREANCLIRRSDCSLPRRRERLPRRAAPASACRRRAPGGSCCPRRRLGRCRSRRRPPPARHDRAAPKIWIETSSCPSRRRAAPRRIWDIAGRNPSRDGRRTSAFGISSNSTSSCSILSHSVWPKRLCHISLPGSLLIHPPQIYVIRDGRTFWSWPCFSCHYSAFTRKDTIDWSKTLVPNVNSYFFG